jgi:hypothetical protein
MGVSCKVGAFSTTTGTSAIDVTCGFQPKAIIFWWSGTVSTTDTVLGGDGKFSFGFASQTERCCVVSTDDNAVGTQAASQGYRMDSCVGSLTVNTGTWDGLLDIDSLVNWPSDGFRLVVDDAWPISARIGFIAYGGSDITNVDIINYTERTTAGTTDVTTNGSFQPDIVFLLSTQNAGADAPTFADNSQGGATIGYGRSGSEMGVLSGGVDTGAGTSDTGAYCLDSECTAQLGAASPVAPNARTSFTQMNADGFRTTWVEGGFAAQRFAMCIKGGLWKGGALTTVTGTSTDISISGIGGTPKGVLVASANRVESTANTGTAPMKMSFGAATSTTEEHCQAIVSSEGETNMRVVRAVEHDSCYINITDPAADIADDAAGALDGVMDVFSVDSDGFTFRMSDGDPSGMFAWWVMVGEAVAGSNGARALAGPSFSLAARRGLAG